MLYSENCNKYSKVQYFDKCIKIAIINIPNNKYYIGNLYFEILEIFKLNKVDIITEYCEIEYLVNNANDLKIIFKSL